MMRPLRAPASPLLLVPLLAALLWGDPAVAGPPAQKTEPDPSFALPDTRAAEPQTVNSTSLVENARAWDGVAVVFSGEAVGEGMIRGERAWIHLNDDAYMWKNIEEGAVLGGYNSGQAVWVPAAAARRIAFYGDYRHEGDILRATGTFHAACREHGGDMDIHADTVETVRPGHPVAHVVNRGRAVIAMALLLAAALLWLLQRKAARRRI